MLRAWSCDGLRVARSISRIRQIPTIRRNAISATSLHQSVGAYQSFPTLNDSERIEVLKRFGTDMRVKDDGIITLKECKMCDKGNRDKDDNLWKLNVFPPGNYHCFRCSCSGSWKDLKQKSLGVFPSSSLTIAKNKDNSPFVIPAQQLSLRSFYNLFPDNDKEHTTSASKNTLDDIVDRKDIKEYLNNVRGLRDDVLQKYGVGFTRQEFLSNENEWVSQVCVTFPWQMPRATLEGVPLNFVRPADEFSTSRDHLIVRTKYRSVFIFFFHKNSSVMYFLYSFHILYHHLRV